MHFMHCSALQYITGDLQCKCASPLQGSQGSWLTARPQLPNLMEHLVNNKNAAIAASVAGGAAGGAIAGPLGVAAGE